MKRRGMWVWHAWLEVQHFLFLAVQRWELWLIHLSLISVGYKTGTITLLIKKCVSLLLHFYFWKLFSLTPNVGENWWLPHSGTSIITTVTVFWTKCEVSFIVRGNYHDITWLPPLFPVLFSSFLFIQSSCFLKPKVRAREIVKGVRYFPCFLLVPVQVPGRLRSFLSTNRDFFWTQS